MPRVKPRSTIYALMPILATLIMAFGIFFTWRELNVYNSPLEPEPRPKLEGLWSPPDPLPQEPTELDTGIPPGDTGAPTGDDGGAAPDDGAAPGDGAAPDDGTAPALP